MELLDSASIDLPEIGVRVVQRCGSTNSVLLAERSRRPLLLAAEEQTAGRGRRGRRWHSAPGVDVTFSLALCLARPPRELAALSLVAGVATASALRALGVAQASLKWPNDLMVHGAKLGGILVETRSDGRATRAVIGIGINCRRDPRLEKRVRRRIASLEDFVRVPRNLVIRQVARALLAALDGFERSGFEAVRRQWETMDAHAGQHLRVRLADGRSISGIGGGIASDGALRLLTRRGERNVYSGRIVFARCA